MAVNIIKELDFELENDNAADENEDSITSLLLKYSEENNNNNNNIKNNNDEDEDTSGLSSLLSKFSLTKLRSQKWAKPVARFLYDDDLDHTIISVFLLLSSDDQFHLKSMSGPILLLTFHLKSMSGPLKWPQAWQTPQVSAYS